MRGAIPPLTNTPSWRGAQLKHRDNFTFTFSVPRAACSSHFCSIIERVKLAGRALNYREGPFL
jgi:hypothetical protein